MKKLRLGLLTTTLLMTLAAKAATFTLGTTFSTESAAAGTNSVILAAPAATNTWTASMNVSWLHLSSTNGTGSATVIYSFDANVGPTRTGTLTIAGLTFTVTQAGPSYVATSAVSNLVSSGLNFPVGLAIDGGGNVFISDYNNNAIKKWNVTNNTVSTLVSSNALTPIKQPGDLALDSSGNVCFADGGNNAIKRWNVTTSTMTTLVSSNASTPLYRPASVALDSAGNVYIADSGNNAIKKWTVSTSTMTTLVSSGLSNPTGVSVDAAGNVYIADLLNNAIKKWSVADSNVTTVVSSGLVQPVSVMVDGAGNLVIADSGNSAIKVWSVVSNTLSTKISTGLATPYCAEVDANGSFYIADSGNHMIKKAPDALVDTATVSVSPIAGTNTLSAVLPVTVSLRAPFVPTSDAAWLTVNGNTNGVITYSYTTNLSATRTGNITVLGKTVPIRQSGPTYSLGTTNIVEGAASDGDTVTLTANYNWTATANVSWLHLSTTSGTASTNLSFTFDANTGATRTGTLTIAGLTLTVVQVGTNYVAANSRYTLVSSGLSEPAGIAVDRNGNAYIADSQNNAVVKWTASSGTASTLISSGVDNAEGVAVDGSGNVYVISRQYVGMVRKWTATNGALTTVIPDGLYFPSEVAVDGTGNLYVADTGNAAIKMWTAANNTLTTLVSSGLSNAMGVAVDASGNVYIADRNNNAVKKWSVANNTVTTLFSGVRPSSVTVDGSGNVYFADDNNNSVKKWDARTTTLTPLSSGFSSIGGVAVDSARNLFMTDTIQNTVYELTRAWVDPSTKTFSAAAASDVLPVVLPSTANLSGPFGPTSDATWLTINGVTNGIVSFSVTANLNPIVRTAHINLLGQSITVMQSFNNALGTTNLVVGSSAGTDSVLLASATNWTATANAAWLHLSADNQSGTGSTNVVFTFDANPGATRAGTLTIGGQTLTITQAGTNYVAVNSLFTLASGLSSAAGIGVDGSGNVYFSDTGDDTLKKWTATNGTVSTLVSSGVNMGGIAVDSAGNVYMADYQATGLVKKWTAANNTVTTLVSNGLAYPVDVAVDRADNIYIVGNNAIKQWTAANNTVTTLVSSGLSSPQGAAVDDAGNVYIADYSNNAIKKRAVADGSVSTVVSTGLSTPNKVAVDGSGNIYIADKGHSAIKQWSAAAGGVATLIPLLGTPGGVAVDSARNLYVTSATSNTVYELPRAWVDPAAKTKSPAAGSDVLPAVLPANINLSGMFAPTSDASWLTITGVTNGAVSYSFTANAGISVRTAHISLLGQSIAVTQNFNNVLGATNLVEGPAAGTDSVVLGSSTNWTATTNASWLHLSPANQSGTGSTNVVFTFDANPGATRTGTLTIGGLTLSITQAGVSYVSATPFAQVFSSDTNVPNGLTVDSVGNIYVADGLYDNAVKKWTVTNNTLSTLVASGLVKPLSLAADSAGNIFIADTGNNAIKRWTAANQTVTPIATSGLNTPEGIAVDGDGNVYIADTLNHAIKKWTAADNTTTTLVGSGLAYPQGVAVDAAGNVYIADSYNNAIKKWTAADGTISTLVSSGLNHPFSVAVDGSGNVFIADSENHVIKKWTATSGAVTTPVPTGLVAGPNQIDLDASGTLYIANSNVRKVNEMPQAWVDTTGVSKSPDGGSDVLPVILPATVNLSAPLMPTSDVAWLTVNGVTNGVVSYSFTANTAGVRVGHLTVLGQSIAITQGSYSYTLGTTNLLESASSGSDSVVLKTTHNWTAVANDSWLHLSAPNQSGSVSTNVIFTYDANPGATRTGTLSIAGVTVTVTQVGSTYVSASTGAALVSTGVNNPSGPSVDASGNMFFADTLNNAIKKWSLSNNVVTTVVSSGLSLPSGTALDATGNIYIVDSGNNAIKMWSAANSNVITLVSTGLSSPQSAAVDAAGNVYIADTGNNAVKKWTATNSSVTTLISSGLNSPQGVAVDAAGNVYVADKNNLAVKEWIAANSNVITRVSAPLEPVMNFEGRESEA